MSLKKLKSEKIILENRLARLQAQDTQFALKQDKRLQILIGTALLAELELLITSDTQAYELEKIKLREILTKHTSRQRDREFLAELDLITS